MKNPILLLSLLIWGYSVALEIRAPHQHEVAEIAELYYCSWHATYATMAPYLKKQRTRQACLEKWQRYYKQGNGMFMRIALDHTKIVGVLFAGPIEDNSLPGCATYDAEIDKLYVLPGMQRKGVGSALLKAGFDQLRANGYTKVIVQSLTKNKQANKFYEKHGGKLLAQPTIEFDEKLNIYGYELH